MTRLQDQLDELDLLESVFSAPGEFEIEDRESKEKAEAFVNQLTSNPPGYLSCRLCIPVSAHHDSGDEGSDVEEGADSGGASADSYSVNISVRLSSRLVLGWEIPKRMLLCFLS